MEKHSTHLVEWNMRNIVLITFDSLRADHCGHGGYERETTPELDELVDEGVSFSKATAPASRTNPSMSTIMTGEPLGNRDRVANAENSRRHLARHGTIASDLQERGYRTGAFNPNAYASSYYGFDHGYDHFQDFLFQSETYRQLFAKHLNSSSVYTTIRNLRNFVRREEAFRTWDTYVDQIESWVRNGPEPFFVWAFSMDTHFPYLTPRRHRRWSSTLDQYYYNWLRNRLIGEYDADLDDDTHRGLIDIYDDAIRFADMLIGELRDRLSDFDPVFVVHADHGEAFGERGVYGHFHPSLYEEHTHVPLVVGGTDRTDSISRPVSLRRLRWMIDRISRDADFIPDDKTAISSEYDGSRDRMLAAVKADEWKYLQKNEDETTHEMYNLTEDPDERNNRYREDDEASQGLAALVNRHLDHRREMMEIERAVSALDKV